MIDNICASYRYPRGSKTGRFNDSLAIATTLMCCFAAVSCSKPSAEERVKEAFHVYMDAWEKGDLDSVWNMMSARLKRGNDNNVIKFKEFTNNQGFAPSGYKIGRVEVVDRTAQARATIQFQDSRGRAIGREREECQFIFFANRWYFDDCKPSGVDK